MPGDHIEGGPARFTAGGAALLVVDVQEKLLPAIDRRDILLENALKMVKGAGILGIPVFATEQYPRASAPR